MEKIEINILENNEVNKNELIDFLKEVDEYFVVPLSKKVIIEDYVIKTLKLGINIAARINNKIVAVVLGYGNDKVNKIGYLSTIVVKKEFQGRNIANNLIKDFKEKCVQNGMEKIRLFVHVDNNSAIKLYKKCKFEVIDEQANYSYNITMEWRKEKMTNILLTSVGRRGYLVSYFKEALAGNGKVFVSNSSDISPAFNYADESVVTPMIYDEGYIDFLLDYCFKNNIKTIVSLFDIDLPILSKNKKRFEDVGIKIIVSDINVIDICNDKYKTYKFLKDNGFNVKKTYLSKDDVLTDMKDGKINYPLIIKPRWGMGSISVLQADNEEELNVLYNKTFNNIKNTYLKYESNEDIENAILIQEKINGQEYGIDIINDLNGNYINTIVKKKLAMRSGETDCAIVEKNEEIKEIGEKISKLLKHIANMDVDLFVEDNKIYVLEMNARFGGGYPFSHMAGVNLPKAIINWISNEEISENLFIPKKYDKYIHKDINIVELNKK